MLLIVLTSLFATAFNTSSSNWITQVLQNAVSLAAFVTYEDKAAFFSSIYYVLYYCVRL